MSNPTITAAEVDGRPSFDDLRGLIVRALNGGSEIYGPSTPYVVECGDASCIVARDGKHYRYPYTVDVGGAAVTLGAPVEAKLSWLETSPPGPLSGTDEGESEVPAVQARDEGALTFVTDLRGLSFSDPTAPVRIEVCRDGEWAHPKHGAIKVDAGVRQSFVDNFEFNVRRCGDLPMDYDHEPGPAPGWITGLVNDGSRLLATVALTPSGREKIQNAEYRFFSPEWHPDWQDPETGRKHGPTLFGGGLTNRPFIRGMAAINCSEPHPPTGDVTTEKDITMDGTVTPAAQVQNTEVANTITAAEVEQLRGRIRAVEVENATFRAAEERRGLTDTLGALRFNEGGSALAPISRNALADALMGLPMEKRKAVLDAMQAVQFVPQGERGFGASETSPDQVVTLTAKEEADIRKMAEDHGQKPDEVRAIYAEAKKRRLQATGKLPA